MSNLEIRFFGGLRVWRDGVLLRPFPTQRSQSLFAYLALNRRRSYPRDVLVGVLWGDEPDGTAKKWLRTALWRARRTVDWDSSEGAMALRAERGSVGFSGSPEHWVDVEEFERLLDSVGLDPGEILDDGAMERVSDAVELYEGDALDGMYDEWCLFERERLRLRYCSAVEALVRGHAAHQRWGAAIAAGRRLLRIEPLREHVHRDVMRFHMEQGDRPGAVRQYEVCRRILREELGIEPMEQTRRLYQQIRSEESPMPGEPPAPTAGRPPPDGRSGLRSEDASTRPGPPPPGTRSDRMVAEAQLRRAAGLLEDVERALEHLRLMQRDLEASRIQLSEMVGSLS